MENGNKGGVSPGESSLISMHMTSPLFRGQIICYHSFIIRVPRCILYMDLCNSFFYSFLTQETRWQSVWKQRLSHFCELLCSPQHSSRVHVREEALRKYLLSEWLKKPRRTPGNTDGAEETGDHHFSVLSICIILFFPIVPGQSEVDRHWNDKLLHRINYCFPMTVQWKSISQRHWHEIDYKYVFTKQSNWRLNFSSYNNFINTWRNSIKSAIEKSVLHKWIIEYWLIDFLRQLCYGKIRIESILNI